MIHLNPGKCANINIQYYSTSDSLDRVIYRTRAHRFDKPQRRISVTDQDHPELGETLPFPAASLFLTKFEILRETKYLYLFLKTNFIAEYKPLNEQTRAWILAGAKNDESKLRMLLNQVPKIYRTRDPSTGYTALHWAAKHGNEDLIHLLIGRYRYEIYLGL